MDEATAFWSQFNDARKVKPEPGQVMAIFRTMAEFVDSPEKRNFINLVMVDGKAEAAVKVMQKLHFAHPLDAIRIPLRIARDLSVGHTVEQVCQFPYPFQAEMYFFCDPGVVPENDPHWTIVPLEFPKIDVKIKTKSELIPSE